MAQVNPVPQGLHTLTPQLVVEGAAEAIEFYKKAFGAQERSRSLDPSGRKIWHAELAIGDSAFYVNDSLPEMGDGAPLPGALWIYSDRADELFKQATNAGAKVTTAMADQFWGDRMGSLQDKWGIRWTIARRVKNLSAAEMKVAQDEFVKKMKPAH